ncbi:helix-turn-helix domain-containing protein [Polaribacter sp. Z014]|uniref:helix-turn-helix domain-containing protein n=1 Tax=Polaribacter sp. Z014 TaxID=2927126 RepID=UPI00201FCDE3|nr:helix-turn-helix domain-containing protein [Polaribacter sp. Z014]MCL7763916.1 helix-turn-helix domain-containing protein [Polaribacter sp. Z014]
MQTPFIKNFTINDVVKIIGDKPQINTDLHIHLSKNNFNETPFLEPFRAGNYTFLLILKGTLKVQLNLITHLLESSEMIVVKPQTVSQIIATSSDLEIIGVSFTVDFIFKILLKKTEFDAIDFLTANSFPKLKLLEEEKETSIILSKLLAKNNNAEALFLPFRNEIIMHSFGLLLYHYGSIFKREHPDLDAHLNRQQQLTLKFLTILNDHFKKERSVNFYADRMHLTSAHLSKVLKEISGKTAGQLIDATVIMEAKLLLSNPLLSVSEVANELNFSNLSFFGKYFKKNTGVSPSYFRKNI